MICIVFTIPECGLCEILWQNAHKTNPLLQKGVGGKMVDV